MSDQRDRVKSAPIVAELGRPETPEETATRKADNSRAHRANQTTRNLILALIASLAVVLCTVLLVVRPDHTPATNINYRAIAAQAQPDITTSLAAPTLPAGWRSNDAELKEDADNAQTWYIGLLTPKQQFIALEEGIDTTDAWFGSLLGQIQATGSFDIDGVHWTSYNQRTAANPGNFAYSLSATIGSARLVLHGSADDAEFHALATAVSAELARDRAKG
jgi:hypothetical protein